jgi:cob(I)alamin adenosyltransferase
MARIYTRTGDEGETALFDGGRTSKSDPRVALYGGVDELNSIVGLAVAHLGRSTTTADTSPDLEPLAAVLARVQTELLELGAVLAHPARSIELREAAAEAMPWSVAAAEADIDAMQKGLPPLKSFILPGGTAAAATLHLARTVCRRVERRAVAVSAETAIPAQVLVYLNRLSDLFFVAARWSNHRFGVADVTWPDRR